MLLWSRYGTETGTLKNSYGSTTLMQAEGPGEAADSATGADGNLGVTRIRE